MWFGGASRRRQINKLTVLKFWASLSPVLLSGIFSDSSYVAQPGSRILQQLKRGFGPHLPRSNLDCWDFLLNASRGADLEHLDLVKAKAHQDCNSL